jgi:nicotinate-nucleotide adenylyltransferase
VRLGLFGGTFDPPHVGHLLAATDACDYLALDKLVFIPAALQPLKAGRTVAPAEARLEMLQATVDGDPRFSVDPVEIERGGLSFTVDTLQSYAERHSGAERFFFVGVDALHTLDSWREPGRVVSLARLAVLARATAEGALVNEAELRQRVRALGGAEALDPVVLTTRRVDVSSTEIRGRVREGKPVRGFVLEAVARCIEERGLYR